MRKMISVLLFLMLFLLADITGAAVIAPDNPNIQYMGRWNFDDPSAPWADWKGTSVKVRFNGTAITADLDAGVANEQYRVIVDGVPNQTTLAVAKNRAVYTLASGLPSGEHVVELMKETFMAFRTSHATFYGFDITGTIMSPPAKPAMRIEWFGDSNMDGSSLYSEQDQGDHGSYYAYPAVVSRMLNAEFNDESVSGATLDNGGDNDVRSFIFSEDYFNQDSSYRSDFDPHLIVINAGANDVGAGKNEIKQRYKDVIADLRLVYGSAPHIVLFNAYGWDTDEPAIYTHEVVSEVGGNLSACVYPWMWAQYHGSMIEHAGQANLLVDHILSLGLGFTKVQDSEIFDGFGRNFNVANGSFEGSGKSGFNAYGWRYYDDQGVERIYDPAGAYDGDYYLELTGPLSGNHGSVEQGTDATGDFLPGGLADTQYYDLTLWMKGTSGAQAEIITRYQTQQMYDYTGQAVVHPIDVTSSNWQQYNVTLSAPAGIWLTYVKIRSANGTIGIDAVTMAESSGGSYCGDGTCDPGEDSCNCSDDCGPPPSSESICDDGIDEDCDGYTDCYDIDCDGDPACPTDDCGNGICDPGEDCNTCPSDCISKTGGKPGTQYCCGDGVCEGAEDSSNCAVDCGSGPVCGDGTCDPGEDSDNCPEDCSSSGACNSDGICGPGEDCGTCPSDCDGVTGGKPSNRYCCGNGIAEGPEGDGTICDGNY